MSNKMLYPVTVKTNEKGNVVFEVNGQPVAVTNADFNANDYTEVPTITITVPVRFGDVRS